MPRPHHYRVDVPIVVTGKRVATSAARRNCECDDGPSSGRNVCLQDLAGYERGAERCEDQQVPDLGLGELVVGFDTFPQT